MARPTETKPGLMARQTTRKLEMGMLPQEKLVYDDGLTKQSFADETDINKLLQRAQKTGTLSHLEKFEGQYGDFSDFDFFENQLTLVRGREMFDELPSELRREFQNQPGEFFAYVNNPANAGRLRELLPALAEPGRQHLDVSGRTPPDDPTNRPAGADQTPEVQPAPQAENPAEGNTEAPAPTPAS